MSIFIVSKASTDMAFVKYSEAAKNGIPKIVKKVVIKGGANVAQKKTFITPQGVVTRVSSEDLEFLLSNSDFLRVQANGFMSVINDDRDMDRAAKDMTPKDKSAPKVAADYALGADLTDGKIRVGAPAVAA
jgi:hypothetical protein